MPDRSRGAAPAVELARRRLLIGGEPRLALAGEVHYFRVARADWGDRLDALAAAGCDTLATYVPWLWHELPDRSVDLTGETHEQRDLLGYLDLAAERGLRVVVRPGPFVMAELKNEGIPYRVYDAPGVLPTTWDGAVVPTRTADYLAPAFLEAAHGWYQAVMPAIAERQVSRGGAVIAVQLDNEVGMLSWVTNAPDLTDVVCADVREWARARWGPEEAARRVGAHPDDAAAWAAALRTPDESVTLSVHHTLGLAMRDRYRRYLAILRQWAEQLGVTDVPFLVNVHGTDQGRGRTYPIGISQLVESYRGQPGMTAGSDLYLGDLTVTNVADLYVANAFLAAVQDEHQPLMSLEFEAGTGDYAEDLATLTPLEAVDLKTRVCLAQGNRLLNFYLFAGGRNPALAEPVGDGNDRIAFTGERHGFAAPVGPEGQHNPTYEAVARALGAVHGVADLVADGDQEYDGVALGFVLDHYLTEYRHPGSPQRAEQVADLERHRGLGPRDVLARALVLGGYSFPAVDLQAGPPDPARTPVLALGSPATLDRRVQGDLLTYVRRGGRLLLSGLLPDRDQDGRRCRVLADGLGIRARGRHDESLHCFPSVIGQGWAAGQPEVRTSYVQLLDAPTGRSVLRVVGAAGSAGVEVQEGAGRALVLGCDYPCHFGFWHAALASLGVRRRWVVDGDVPGPLVVPTATPDGQRLLHLVNVTPYVHLVSPRDSDAPFLDGRPLRVPARAALTVPVRVTLDGAVLLGSTAEVVRRSGDEVWLRPTQQGEDVAVVQTARPVHAKSARIDRDGDRLLVRWDSALGLLRVALG